MNDRRTAPFVYQTVGALRLLHSTFTGSKRVTAVAIYNTLTYLANEARSREGFEAGRSIVADTTGVSKDTVDRYLRDFERIGLVRVERQRHGDVNLPNRWVLVEVAAGGRTPAGGGRTGAATGSRTGAANTRAHDAGEEELQKNPPNPPLGGSGEQEALLEAPTRKPRQVGRKVVNKDEWRTVDCLIETFNQTFKTKFQPTGDNARLIVMRLRDFPEVSPEQHKKLIRRVAEGRQWWNDGLGGKPDGVGIVWGPRAFPKAMNGQTRSAETQDRVGDGFRERYLGIS